MTSEQIAYSALIASTISLIVSFLTLYRDRHVVSVRAVPVGDSNGIYSLHRTVMNSGKRPISINHVLIRPPCQPGLFLSFVPNGQGRIDVVESRSCQIKPDDLPVSWSTIKELRSFNIYALDAIGKKHLATWEGMGKILALTNQLTSRLWRRTH